MKRTHLLSTAAVLASALLAAAPAPAQQTPQDRATAAVDRMHKGNGADNGGPAELLRSAQAAMRRGQAAEANELLERAETRLLLRDAAGPAAGMEPTRHLAEARRALADRDRAEAMRHTNLAIASIGADGAAGGDTGGFKGAAEGGGPGAGGRTIGAVDSGMGGPVAGRAVVRDAGTAGASVNRAEGVLLAQSGGTGAGPAVPPPVAPRTGRGVPPAATLPPGDTLPGWSGPAGGAMTQQPTPRGLIADPAMGGNSRGGGLLSGAPNLNAGPGSANMTGGEPARVGGAPPGDTSRAPGSSGIGGAGVGTSGVGGPVR